VTQALPLLRPLEVYNRLEQQEKITTTTNNLKFTHLTELILFTIYTDYAEQLLCQTYLPCINELAIDIDILLAIIAQDKQIAGDNCSRMEKLRTSKPLYNSVDAVRHFFPPDSYLKHSVKEQIK